MDVLKHYKIDVVADGERLKQYELLGDETDLPCEDGDIPQQTRYIQAKEGRTFEIRYELSGTAPWPKQAKILDVYLDGICVESEVRDRPAWDDNVYGTISHHEFDRNSVRMGAKFVFKHLHLAHTSSRASETDCSEMGEILIRISDAYTKAVAQDELWEEKKQLGRVELSEQSLKGSSADVRSELAEATKVRTAGCRVKCYEEVEIGWFLFRYRSKKALKSLGIIERTPSPVPSLPLEERNIDTLSPKEMKALVLKLKQNNVKIKQEKMESSKRSRTSDDEECSFIGTKKVRIAASKEDAVDLDD